MYSLLPKPLSRQQSQQNQPKKPNSMQMPSSLSVQKDNARMHSHVGANGNPHPHSLPPSAHFDVETLECRDKKKNQKTMRCLSWSIRYCVRMKCVYIFPIKMCTPQQRPSLLHRSQIVHRLYCISNTVAALRSSAAVFSIYNFALSKSLPSTKSRIAGKWTSRSLDHSGGPNTTCLNCVRSGI